MYELPVSVHKQKRNICTLIATPDPKILPSLLLTLQFYAPWCGYCKKLEPVWNEVGMELRTSGSPVRVGKMDATAYSGE